MYMSNVHTMLPLVRCPKMVATSVTCCTATSTIRPLHPLSLVFISCSCHRFPCCTIDYIRSWHQLSCQGSGVMSTPSQPPANYLAARMQSKHAIASLYPNSDSSSNITISTPIERGAFAFSCHPSHFPAHLPCHNRAANCLGASHHGLLAHVPSWRYFRPSLITLGQVAPDVKSSTSSLKRTSFQTSSMASVESMVGTPNSKQPRATTK